jgi:hypothetical protein
MLVIDKAQDLDDMSLFLFMKLTMESGPLMLLLGYNDISLESRPAVMRVRKSSAIGTWACCELQVSLLSIVTLLLVYCGILSALIAASVATGCW